LGNIVAMPQSLIKVLAHVVFSTRDRVALIPLELESELYKYIHGIIQNHSARLIIAGGTANHLHLLISIGKNDIPKLIGDIKRSTSVWMKKKGIAKFYWQKGYGAFSVGQSQVAVVSRYIRDQKEHHKKQDYKDEFRALCGKYQVEIDERFVWD
jgi:REP element-mobilizing transposase RayT